MRYKDLIERISGGKQSWTTTHVRKALATDSHKKNTSIALGMLGLAFVYEVLVVSATEKLS